VGHVSKKTTYHHGNLRRTLLDEALEVIGDKGVEGLSLREIATRAGVSHAAPYHHFSDKAALVQALAHEGMAMLDESMAAAEIAAGEDAGRRLLGIGMAYVKFAAEHPDHYAAFTAPEMALLGGDTPEPGEGGTWERLMGAVLACQRSGELPAGDPLMLAVYLWALVHGLAELWRTGPLPRLPHAEGGLEPLARQVLETALRSQRCEANEHTQALDLKER